VQGASRGELCLEARDLAAERGYDIVITHERVE